jgi:hypothetical protein
METISTGEPNTLGTYRNIAMVLSGDENSKVVRFFDDKIAKSPSGAEEKVIAAESQVMYLIGTMLTVEATQ